MSEWFCLCAIFSANLHSIEINMKLFVGQRTKQLWSGWKTSLFRDSFHVSFKMIHYKKKFFPFWEAHSILQGNFYKNSFKLESFSLSFSFFFEAAIWWSSNNPTNLAVYLQTFDVSVAFVLRIFASCLYVWYRQIGRKSDKFMVFSLFFFFVTSHAIGWSDISLNKYFILF